MCLGFGWSGQRKWIDKECPDKMSKSQEEYGTGDQEKKARETGKEPGRLEGLKATQLEEPETG